MANPFESPTTSEPPIAAESPGERHVSTSDFPLTPWTSIWTKPRQTVRQVLDTDPKRHVLLLAALAGASNALGNGVELLANAPDLKWLLGLCAEVVLIGAVVSMASLFVGAWILTGLGRLSGGVGRSFELRTAIAYANIISVWCLPLNLCAVLLSWYVVHNPGEIVMAGVLMAIGLMMIVCGIWYLVVLCATIAEAHQFSGRLGAATVLLPILLGVAIVLGVLKWGQW